MTYISKFENCIHFDGKECRNCISPNYGSYGELCINCEYFENTSEYINYNTK